VTCFALLLAAGACGGSSGGSASAPVLIGSIDQNGGVFEVTQGPFAGVKVEVPAGAVASPLQLTVASAFSESTPGFRTLSRAVTLGPSDVEFALPVTVTLPFNDGSLPVSSRPVVLERDSEGRIVELGGSEEPEPARVAFPTLQLGTFWVNERLFGGVNTTGFPGYLPLANGNRWTFDNGITITATQTTQEPNLAGTQVFRFLIESAGQNLGFYLRGVLFGPTLLLGEFSTNGGTDFQRLHDPSPFLPAQLTLGRPIETAFSQATFEPYGSTTPASGGILVEQIDPWQTDPVVTAVGRFDTVVTVRLQLLPLTGDLVRPIDVELTFANTKGPVAVRAFGSSGVLTSGTVSGQPVTGN
jgi:hypothetical protein